MSRLIVITLLLVTSALAAPPPDADTGLAPWYHSLKVSPDNPYGMLPDALCCDVADCRNVPAEIRGDGHWWAWVDSMTYPDEPQNPLRGHAPNAWVEIPDNVILHRHDNPTGDAVLCWYDQRPRCFVRGPQT